MEQQEWASQWIWSSVSAEQSRHLYFRGTMEVEGFEILEARLKVCADTRYRLWLNGQMLGHGPARSDTANQYYDIYDVTDAIKQGENLFAALVIHYGIGTCYSRLGSPGFLLEIEVTFRKEAGRFLERATLGVSPPRPTKSVIRA